MKYFKMKEFECRDGCEMPIEAKANITALVEKVLDPAREQYGKPICVNSGYRCPRHNLTVGGVKESQHMRGEAADIRPVQGLGFKDELDRMRQIIEEQGAFDQMIVYDTFLHVSYTRGGVNRHQMLRKTSSGYVRV